ncbi:MAG: protein jag [Clostridia bacterium]|nr:protein jag [Clostridia bacterium]
MQTVEKKAKTKEEAIRIALEELGVKEEQAIIEILEEPSKGFLGILAKPALVRVSVEDSLGSRAKAFLNQILEAMEIEAEIVLNETEDCVNINLNGADLGILIGRRGDTMDALQYLISLAVNRGQEVRKKIFLDIEDYRAKREITLQNLAMKLADKAVLRGRNVVLEPMSSLERRVIHTALQSRNDVATFSEGEEPYRKIIITPKR